MPRTLMVLVLVASGFAYLVAHKSKAGHTEPPITKPCGFSSIQNSFETVSENEIELQDSRGSIKSANFPRNYPNNLSCFYRIVSLEGTRIQLIFRDVQLQRKEKGECVDYVEVFDGVTTWSQTLEKFCGNGKGVVNEPIISSGTKLRIKFHTDGRYAYKGFMFTYDPYQPEKVTDMTQKVTGVVIGTACGLVFLILTFLAICHSRRLSLLRRRDTTRYEMAWMDDGPDVIGEGAPPSYDDVMSSPDKYPPTPSGRKKTPRFVESRHLSESYGSDDDDEPPPYPGLVLDAEPGDHTGNNPQTTTHQYHAILSRSISTDV